MFNSGLTKKKHIQTYIIYKAIFSSPKFTVAKVADSFKSDAKEWKASHQTELSTALHAYLSSQFKEGSNVLLENAHTPYITRQKDADNVWVYSIDLTSEPILTTCIDQVRDFLRPLELSIFLDDHGNEISREIGGQDDVFMRHEKIYQLWEWYEERTGELFEYALVN